MGGMLLYAVPLGAHRGDLDSKKASLSDETELSDLINEESSDSMSFIMENVILKTKELGGIFFNS